MYCALCYTDSLCSFRIASNCFPGRFGRFQRDIRGSGYKQIKSPILPKIQTTAIDCNQCSKKIGITCNESHRQTHNTCTCTHTQYMYLLSPKDYQS